ncbi:MAG: hypothetical protein RRY22_06180, partial [Bacilli bacterium]
EFVLTHELTHSIATDEMINLANDYASKNPEFNDSVKSLLNQYNKKDIDEEVLADISGQLFGNQEFINNLSMEKPTVFKQVYNKIIEWANKLTGNSKESLFIKDLKNKWESAYRNIDNNDSNNNNIKLSKETLKDGTSYIKTENNVFTNTDGTPMTQREVFKSLIGQEIKLNDGTTAEIVKRLPDTDIYNELFKRIPKTKNVNDKKIVNETINNNITELLSNSNDINTKPDVNGRHTKQKITDFNTREVLFYDGNDAYSLTFSIAILDKGKRVAYAKKMLKANPTLLTKIKQEDMSSTSSNGRSSQFPQVVNNIPQSNNDVKSDISNKYSMQEKDNDTQELESKQKSFEELSELEKEQAKKIRYI